MALLETPPLLALGSLQDYLDRFRIEYLGGLTTSEGKRVIFFLKEDGASLHAICGGDLKGINNVRAQRILWVRFVLEGGIARVVLRALSNGYICFYCDTLDYLVVCQILPWGDLKFVSQYMISKSHAKKFGDTTKYAPHAFA